ncbi:hypothetical protein BGX26_003454 [Mortierella sp. AD094]|nr:hypothetical protein BGX26_003454 [Mortierella sp. AD094]
MERKYQRSINILLISETQSEKSKFAEALKQYADPNYRSQEHLISNGIASQTADVREETICTNLPFFSVSETKQTAISAIIGGDTPKRIKYDKFIVEKDRDDYEDLLSQRRCLKMNQIRSIPMQNRHQPPTNIILIGETKSGKSTFAEALKLYANPNYKIQEDLKTTDVREYTIRTNFPVFGVFKSKPWPYLPSKDASLPVCHEKFINYNREDYEEAIDTLRGHEIHETGKDDRISEFTVIDTPGFQTEDEEHIARIFSKLQQGRPISLVLVMVPNGTFTPSLVSALEGYIDMFPELTNVLTFVHTRVDYRDLHPESKQLSQSLELKMQTLNDNMSRKTFSHFVIDCDLTTTKPIRKCITYSTIRKILRIAQQNIPISVLSSGMIRKTPKMVDVDTVISMRSKSILTATEETLQFKGEDEDDGMLLGNVYKFETSVAELDAKIRNNQDLLQDYNTDDLELLYEERFHDERQVLPTSYTRECIVPEQSYPIDEIVQWSEFFNIKSQDEAWKGMRAYRCTCTKTDSDWSGFYHIKLYVKRRNRYKHEIKHLSQVLKEQHEEREKLHNEKEEHLREFQKERAKIQPLIDKHKRQMQLIRLTSAVALKSALFHELLEAKAYIGSASTCSQKAEDIYMAWIRKRKFNKPLPSNPLEDSFFLTQSEAAGHGHQNISPLDLVGSQDNIKVEVSEPSTLVQIHMISQADAQDGIKVEINDTPAWDAALVSERPEERDPCPTNTYLNIGSSKDIGPRSTPGDSNSTTQETESAKAAFHTKAASGTRSRNSTTF